MVRIGFELLVIFSTLILSAEQSRVEQAFRPALKSHTVTGFSPMYLGG
jgi:hypothetical protein